MLKRSNFNIVYDKHFIEVYKYFQVRLGKRVY